MLLSLLPEIFYRHRFTAFAFGAVLSAGFAGSPAFAVSASNAASAGNLTTVTTPVAAAVAATTPPISLAPSVDLTYTVKASQNGMTLGGQSVMQWRVSDGQYSIAMQTRAMIVGKVLDERSEGAVSKAGLVPTTYTEQRFRKEASTTRFDRSAGIISFGASQQTQPLLGNEQDRSSAVWQLIAMARATRKNIVPGTTWRFPVAGQQDAELWTFKVEARQKQRTALGDVDTVHIVRMPMADAKDRKLDIWLAPSLDWYPVRLRFSDGNDDTIEQTIASIEKR